MVRRVVWATGLLMVCGLTDRAVGQLEEGSELVHRDAVVYKHASEVDLSLHVWQPRRGDVELRPAIVFFFGGGWRSGSPEQFAPHGERLAQHGFVVFSAEYRVGKRNGTTPFECVKDGKSAVRWVRQHAADYGVDPDRIIAGGGSAGGHVAACTGVIAGAGEEGEDQSISSQPNAMILFNPVIDTGPDGFGHPSFAEDRGLEISPNHHVRPGLPPTLIFHGDADRTVPLAHVERFRDLMREAGNRCVLEIFPGKGHGFFNAGREKDRSFEATILTLLAWWKSISAELE